MRRLYLVLAVLIIMLGLFHTASTARFFDELSSRALWFASAGLLLILAGAINVLNRSYGAAAPRLRWTTVATNLVLTVFAALQGTVGGASGVELAVVVGLMAATALVSASPKSISA